MAETDQSSGFVIRHAPTEEDGRELIEVVWGRDRLLSGISRMKRSPHWWLRCCAIAVADQRADRDALSSRWRERKLDADAGGRDQFGVEKGQGVITCRGRQVDL